MRGLQRRSFLNWGSETCSSSGSLPSDLTSRENTCAKPTARTNKSRWRAEPLSARSEKSNKQTNEKTSLWAELRRGQGSVFSKENDKGRGCLFNFQKADSGSNPGHKRSSGSTVKLKTKATAWCWKSAVKWYVSSLFTICEPGPSFLKTGPEPNGTKSHSQNVGKHFWHQHPQYEIRTSRKKKSNKSAVQKLGVRVLLFKLQSWVKKWKLTQHH